MFIGLCFSEVEHPFWFWVGKTKKKVSRKFSVRFSLGVGMLGDSAKFCAWFSFEPRSGFLRGVVISPPKSNDHWGGTLFCRLIAPVFENAAVLTARRWSGAAFIPLGVTSRLSSASAHVRPPFSMGRESYGEAMVARAMTSSLGDISIGLTSGLNSIPGNMGTELNEYVRVVHTAAIIY